MAVLHVVGMAVFDAEQQAGGEGESDVDNDVRVWDDTGQPEKEEHASQEVEGCRAVAGRGSITVVIQGALPHVGVAVSG